jgi:hypothetical protein
LLLLEKTKHYDVKKYANAGMSENQDPASVEIRANANVNTSKIIGIYILTNINSHIYYIQENLIFKHNKHTY